jgi:lipid-A-disaccharide synthase
MCDAIGLAAETLGPIELKVGVSADDWPAFAGASRRLSGGGIRTACASAHEVLRASRVSLAASGIVLLEACLLDAPVVMTYRIDPASRWVAYHILRLHEKLPHLALPNLVAGERIVPELVQESATPAGMAEEICRLARDANARQRMRDGYGRVRAALGRKGVTRAVAQDILDIVS